MKCGTIKTGFTVIELLVVTAIIGILVGLTLPAVNSIRESSRLTSCQNNLRNQALGMLSYESAHRAFPPGQDAPTEAEIWQPIDWSEHSGLGHLWYMMPFLEEHAVHQKFSRNASTETFGGTTPNLTEAADLRIAPLRCPSDPAVPIAFLRYSTLDFAPGFTVGTVTTTVSANYQGWTNYLGSRGTNKYTIGSDPIVRTGIFFEGSAVKTAEITDGLSHTILMGEVLGGTTGSQLERIIDIRHSVFQNGIGGTLNFFFDPTEDAVDQLSFMFSSSHQGGHLINFSFVDGHVEAKFSDVDEELMRSLTTRAGVFLK